MKREYRGMGSLGGDPDDDHLGVVVLFLCRCFTWTGMTTMVELRLL